jgi:(heptosyl)LPS beta-1,4-glucosyltransferase
MISAIILTKNEEANIADCIESVGWADEVVVLDSESTDSTIKIAQKMGAKVFYHPFSNFPEQRNAAIQLAGTDWILFVDADERVTAELANEVRSVIQNPDIDGWWIPRRSNYFGHWVHYGGFYPDYQLRLARKSKIHYDPAQKVHEIPTLDGKAGYLTNPFIHYCYQSYREWKTDEARYARLMAETLFAKGVYPTYHLIAAPILSFIEQFFVKQSYRDGRTGFQLSLAMAYGAFNIYRHLWLLWKAAGEK